MGFSTTKVNVPVLWDAAGNFKNGEVFSISVSSIINGVVAKPAGPTIPGYPIGNPIDTLFVKDPEVGGLYLNLTLQEYTDLVGATSSSGNDTRSYDWVGDVDVIAGDIIDDPRLDGITILSVNKGGPTIYDYIHAGSTLDLTADGGLAAGENLGIIYKP